MSILSDSQKKKKRTCWIEVFTVPANHRVKIKENEKRDQFLDHARELKRIWNILVTSTRIEIGALGTIPKSFVRGPEEMEIELRAETI